MPRDRGRLPTTAAGAEYGLVLAFVILRVFDLLQLAVATPSSLGNSPAPGLDVALIMVFASESALLCSLLITRRRFDDPRLVWLDVAAGSLVLIATPWFTQPADRFSSWAGWGYAVTLSVVVGAGIGLRHWWQTLTAVGLLAGLYLAVSLPAATTSAQTLTALTNSMAYLMFAVVIRFPAGYMRRLASDADAAREQAASLAQEAERSRHRLLLHDQASVLTLLSREDVDPALASLARAQAAVGAGRVRDFLTDTPELQTSLIRRLEASCEEFADLDIVLNADQAIFDVPSAVVEAIGDAVRTLLHNVRNHAQASEVVIYAATGPHMWQVQVSDNGCGYDADRTLEGFGLSQQVRERVTSLGAVVKVVTAPGEGTIVRLSGATR